LLRPSTASTRARFVKAIQEGKKQEQKKTPAVQAELKKDRI
jgi:hypothetical protein